MITKIIESFLKTVDQATFQNLMNHLLYLDGYKFVGSPGSVIGKNKTSKGSPDSFFEDGDSLCFCEFTTKDRLTNVKTFLEKLQEDVDHCFNVESTKVAKDKISKVILAFTDELMADELLDLKKRVALHNANAILTIYSIQEIPFRLIYYPGLADRYIPGVKTTNGTILTLPDFIKQTRVGVQPSLENQFVGRVTERVAAKTKLAKKDVLVLAGGQGVGKSKLAIQVASELENEGYEIRVIISSPANLWDDIPMFLLPAKKYVLLFDDANKALPNLEYLIGFLKNRPVGEIKLMITVRDYVKQEISKYLLDTVYDELEIEKMDSTELRKLIMAAIPTGFHIDNIFLEHITNFSKGNARLAIMAVQSMINGADVNYLINVQRLYEYYFKKLESDIAIVSDPKKLKALGILSFAGHIDFRNINLNSTLKDHFQIDLNEIHETLTELERFELVDFFGRDTCRLSDQVLGTYVFYKTFLDPGSAVIDYSQWIAVYLPLAEVLVQKTLVDVNNTFGYSETKSLVLPFLKVYQARVLTEPEKLTHLYKVFWPYLEIDTLQFTEQLVDALPTITPQQFWEAVKELEQKEYLIPSKHIELLRNFWRSPNGLAEEALRISLKLILKEPYRTAELAAALHDSFKFNRFDSGNAYKRQILFVNWLCNPDFTPEESLIVDHLFLKFTPLLFGWEFFENSSNGMEQIIHTYQLRKLPGLVAIRRKCLERTFELAKSAPEIGRSLIKKYLRPGRGSDGSLYINEFDLVAPFLIAYYSPASYNDCKIIEEYLDLVIPQKITVPDELKKFLSAASMQVAKLLLFRPLDFIGDFNAREQEKKAEMEKLAKDKDLAFIRNFFREAEKLMQQLDNQGESFWIKQSLSFFLNGLFDNNQALFLQVMTELISGNYDFARSLHEVICYPLYKGIEVHTFYKVLNGSSYPQQQYWKQLFFEAIQQEDLNEFFLVEFVSFLEGLQKDIILPDLSFLLRYADLFAQHCARLPMIGPDMDDIVLYVTQILLSKAKIIDIQLDQHMGERFGAQFRKRPDLLKKVFDYNQSKNNDFDPYGVEMKVLLIYEPRAVLDMIRNEMDKPGFTTGNFAKLDFIWEMVDYIPIIDQAITIIFAKFPYIFNSDHEVNVLFQKISADYDRRGKALEYIKGYIERYKASKQEIHLIFNVVTYSFTDYVLPFLRQFLLLNQDVEFVKDLYLEKSELISENEIPILETEIALYSQIMDMVKKLPNTLKYAGHLTYWASSMESLEKSKLIAQERKFAGLG